MKYYAYTRVSTDTQVENGFGLDTQRTSVKEYSEKNQITISEYFTDEGISGTIYDRPGLTELISVLEKGDKIIVYETSRLWRDEIVRCTLIHTLQKIGCDIISVTQPTYSLYVESPSDWLLNSILGILDEYDKLLVVRKLQAGRKTKAKSGSKACGSAPIGYMWRDKEVIPNPDTVPVVTDIFHLYEEHKSLSKVADICKAKGYKTVRGKDFTRGSLSVILHNNFYIGITTHAGVEYSGSHKPIVDKYLFNNVQAILRRDAV